ncbi:hypothetical protein FNU76_07125 [Chitinimonas arctica]|uniref:5-bromo-4-chloroindolyl phosphate hydrolysis protein n=1 Tax=Chitinimonas arctica TaxID=2594795 RepID=A0A516SDC0_9NEIS|nr:hypothetical protein [Chitinimonas arctica]QDQ26146.1 hypothetical protein FNU76_07125 [Chitinimonas arctica]
MAGQNPWVSGSLPKRGRRVEPNAKPPGKAATQAVQKLLRANQRNLLGRPLRAALLEGAGGKRWHGGKLVLAATVVSGGLAVLVAGLASHGLWLLPIGACLTLAGGYLVVKAGGDKPVAMPGMVSAEEAAELDAFLDSIAARLPPEVLERIAQLKEELARLLPLLRDEQRLVAVPMEERFFIRQLVARYLPDACRHYLDLLPTTDAPDEAARASLDEQLALLFARLEKVRALLQADQQERLSNHAAFLRGKQ